MQTENTMFNDLAKMFTGAAGTFAGMGREAEASAKARAKEWIGGLDFVSRDEFEVVKAMAVAARDEADVLRARLDKIEAGAPTASHLAAASFADDAPAGAASMLHPGPTLDQVD